MPSSENIFLINQSSERMPKKFIYSWLSELVVMLAKDKKHVRSKWKKQNLTVVFLNVGPAKKINFEFRKKKYATDILSFEGVDSATELGELVLCAQVLKRQAKEHGLSFRLELGYMLIHGVLHLLGYDHETNARDAKQMFELQDRLFASLSEKLNL